MQTVENDFIKFTIEDNILHSHYKKNTDLNLDLAKRLIELRHQISNNEHQYWCYNITKLKSFPKDVRDYAEIHGQECLHATAVIINSHVTKFIMNTFLRLKKPRIPFQAFSNTTDAVLWLKKIQELNELNNTDAKK